MNCDDEQQKSKIAKQEMAATKVGDPVRGDPNGAKIAGPISIVPGGVSAERRAWAEIALQTMLTNYQPQDGGVEPNPEADNPAAKTANSPRQISQVLDDQLRLPLAQVGYRRVAKFHYRADWSTEDVEHFLHLRTQYIPPSYLSADMSFLNREADAFADYSRKYAIPSLRDYARKRGRWEWRTGFSLSFLDAWNGELMVKIADVEPETAVAEVLKGVREKLIPYVGWIRTTADLYEFLVRDEEPMAWYRLNTLYRMAEVAYLGKKLGYSDATITDALMPHSRQLRPYLDPQTMPAEQFIANIIADAGRVSAR